MSAREALDVASRLELQARSLYTLLADRLADRSDLRRLVLQLADEEQQHAYRIQALARSGGDIPWDEATDGRIETLLRSMETELATILAAVTQVPGEVPDDILVRVVGFENRFARIHAEHLAEVVSPGMRSLFASLAREDRLHVEMLEEALAP